MTILSYKTIFGLTFSAISENLLESFFRKVPKTVILAIFWHVWPKSAKMRIFIKNQAVLFFYPFCPPTSCQVSEKSLERFPRSIRYIPKNCDFGPKWPFFGTFGQNRPKWEILSKIGPCYFFTLIVPQLHAEFQKNRWSGFRDQFVTYGRSLLKIELLLEKEANGKIWRWWLVRRCYLSSIIILGPLMVDEVFLVSFRISCCVNNLVNKNIINFS